MTSATLPNTRTSASMPRLLLGIEGAALFIAAVSVFVYVGGNWWLFALLLLAPDLTMIGYLRNLRLGAALYNLAHTTTLPLLLLGACFLGGSTLGMQLALIWLAHIGMDRSVGYGLKYASAFKDTHLGRV